MSMREDCKHFQSRTYASGEVARVCRIDMAPEAPWSCPEHCPKYERRLADVGWVRGSLVDAPVEQAPATGPDVVELLDQAEDIVNAVVPDTLQDVQRQRDREDRKRGGTWSRWWLGRRSR